MYRGPKTLSRCVGLMRDGTQNLSAIMVGCLVLSCFTILGCPESSSESDVGNLADAVRDSGDKELGDTTESGITDGGSVDSNPSDDDAALTDVGECDSDAGWPGHSAMCSDSFDGSSLMCNQARGDLFVESDGHLEVFMEPGYSELGATDQNELIFVGHVGWDYCSKSSGTFLLALVVPLDKFISGEREFSFGSDQPSNISFVMTADPEDIILGATSRPGGDGKVSFASVQAERCGAFAINIEAFLPEDEDPNTNDGYKILPGSMVCGRFKDQPLEKSAP